MNNAKVLIFYTPLLFSTVNMVAQLDTKTNAEKNSYSIITLSALKKTNGPALGNTQETSVMLFKKVGSTNLETRIGSAHCTYYEQNKILYLSALAINKKYHQKGFGSYLLKSTLDHVIKTFKNVEKITWLPCPQDDPTGNTLPQLIKFYKKTGAIEQNNNTYMTFPIPSAYMLCVLLPIFEPVLASSDEKQIILATGASYNPYSSDPLGIIAHYMGETNE